MGRIFIWWPIMDVINYYDDIINKYEINYYYDIINK